MTSEKYPTNTPTSVVPDSMSDIVERFNYSPAVRVGPWLYVAGQVGRDAGMNIITPLEDHLVQAWENVGTVLRAAGADYSNIIDLTTWHIDLHAQRTTFQQVMNRYIVPGVGVAPAWSSFEAVNLSFPGLLVEIKAIAFIPE